MRNVRLNIRTKLLGGFGIVLLLTTAVAFMGVRTSRQQNSEMHAIDTEHFPQYEAAANANLQMTKIGRNLRTAILQSDATKVETALKAVDENVASLEESIKTLNSFSSQMTSDEKDLVDTFEASWEKYAEGLKAVVPEIRKNTSASDAATTEILGPMADSFNAADAAVAKLDQINAKTIDETATLANDQATSAARMLITLSVIAILAGMGIGFWMSRDFSARAAAILSRLKSLQEHCLADLRAGMVGLSNGDLSSGVTPVTTLIPNPGADEIGLASAETNKIIEAMVATIAAYNSARGALSNTLRDVRNAATALDQQRTSLTQVAGEAATATDAVASGSNEVSRASTDVARASPRWRRAPASRPTPCRKSTAPSTSSPKR